MHYFISNQVVLQLRFLTRETQWHDHHRCQKLFYRTNISFSVEDIDTQSLFRSNSTLICRHINCQSWNDGKDIHAGKGEPELGAQTISSPTKLVFLHRTKHNQTILLATGLGIGKHKPDMVMGFLLYSKILLEEKNQGIDQFCINLLTSSKNLESQFGIQIRRTGCCKHG